MSEKRIEILFDDVIVIRHDAIYYDTTYDVSIEFDGDERAVGFATQAQADAVAVALIQASPASAIDTSRADDAVAHVYNGLSEGVRIELGLALIRSAKES